MNFLQSYAITKLMVYGWHCKGGGVGDHDERGCGAVVLCFLTPELGGC